MTHLMTPTGVFFVLALAVTIDALSVGPDSIRDRVAFFLAVPAIYEGFNGSPVDQWTIEKLSALIDQAKEAGTGTYIAGAATQAILGIGVFVVVVLTIGVLLPMKASAKLGKFAAYTFKVKDSSRLNWKLWGSAAIIGMFCDLPMGWFGDLVVSCVVALDGFVSILPGSLMGIM